MDDLLRLKKYVSYVQLGPHRVVPPIVLLEQQLSEAVSNGYPLMGLAMLPLPIQKIMVGLVPPLRQILGLLRVALLFMRYV